MTAKAAGVMFNLDLDEPPMVVGVFEDDGEGMDPRFEAEALWKSVENDWPGWDVRYFMNDEAVELMKQRKLWSFGMTNPGDPMHDRIEAHNASIDAQRE
jgi:hypothetical protein